VRGGSGDSSPHRPKKTAIYRPGPQARKAHEGELMASGVRSGRDGFIAASIAVALLAVYTVNGTIVTTHDATSNTFLAANVIQEGRLWFSPSRDPQLFLWKFRDQEPRDRTLHLTSLNPEARSWYEKGDLVPEPVYAVAPSIRSDPRTGERLYVPTYGLGTGLSAVPILVWASIFAGDIRRQPELLWYGAKLAASLFAAASAALLFLTCRCYLPPGRSLVLAALYGLGTCVWSMSSQTLWQHASNAFFIALATLFLVAGRNGTRVGYAAFCGAALGAATACRPTSLAYLVAIAVYWLIVKRRAALAFVAGALPFGVVLAAYNWYYLGSPLRSTQAETATFAGSFWEGIAGLLVSPSRGLFVFSPFLLASVWGAVVVWRQARYAVLRPLTVAVALVVGVHAKWSVWWGGDCYGYRIIADLATTLVLLLVPVAGWILERRARTALFAAACAFSILLQAIGAFAYDVEWNEPTLFVVPLPSGKVGFTDVEEARRVAKANGISGGYSEECSLAAKCHGRLWSLSESQPVSYLTNFSEAHRALVEQTRSMIAWWR